MSTFVNNDVNTGDVVEASDHNTQGALLAAVLNGGIDNANIASGAAISGSKLADASIPGEKLATGVPVQVVGSGFAAVATGTTTTPVDDTIPQNTEGNEFMTITITPKSATNILVIESIALVSHSTATAQMVCALFQDSTANALAASNTTLSATATAPATIPLRHVMTAGTTSSTTFKIRIGTNNAGTTTFNGQAGARQFGAINKSSIVITEYKA